MYLWDPIFGIICTGVMESCVESVVVATLALMLMMVIKEIPYCCRRSRHEMRIKPTRMKVFEH